MCRQAASYIIVALEDDQMKQASWKTFLEPTNSLQFTWSKLCTQTTSNDLLFELLTPYSVFKNITFRR